jgi:hypothetical protein
VISKAHADFWTCFAQLPSHIQQTARGKYALWRSDPFHSSLRFKLIKDDLWSVRITRGYRALGIREGETMYWFWIGTHAEYDRLLK